MPEDEPRHAAAAARARLIPAPQSATEKPTGTTPEKAARPVGNDQDRIAVKTAPDPVAKRPKRNLGRGSSQETIASASPSAKNPTQKNQLADQDAPFGNAV